MATTNDIYRRLQQLGYMEAARAVLGAQPEPPAPLPPLPSPGALPAGPPSIPPFSPGVGEEEEEEEPEPEPQRQAPETGEERYFLQGTGIAIGFHSDLLDAFGALNDLWKRASIGSLRNPDGTPKDPNPRYAPDAIVRGTAVDPGVRVPWEVWKSSDRFVDWCKVNGYEKGVSIEIDGLVAPPGRTVGPVGASPRRSRKQR